MVIGQFDQIIENERQSNGVDGLRNDGNTEKRDAGQHGDDQGNDKLDKDQGVERFALFVVRIQAALYAKEFGKSVGRGKGDRDQAHEAGNEDADGEEGAGQRSGKRFDGFGGRVARLQRNLVDEQGGGGGNDHKEREEVREKGTDVGFHLRIDDLAGFDLFIIGKTADEELPPGGDGGTENTHTDEQITAQIGGGEFHTVRIDDVR